LEYGGSLKDFYTPKRCKRLGSKMSNAAKPK